DFAHKDLCDRVFTNNAVMSSMVIAEFAGVLGSRVAGGAYLPIRSDEALIVDKSGSILLAGSDLVAAAMGEHIYNESLGGATTHCEISGVTDYKAKDDADVLDTIKSIIDKIGDFDKAGYNRIASEKPKENPEDIYGILPKSRVEQYDMYDI